MTSRTTTPHAPDRPLDGVGSITVKIGLLVALSILAAVVVLQVGRAAGVSGWVTLPVTLAAALLVTQWLARGMTSPLREMTVAAGRMATGDYSARVSATSADEVGVLARAFNTMSEDLAGADQQRRQVVATVSHELRTPLAAQRALLENLVDGVVTPDDAALQTALAQSERLSALVGDLLDVSRLDEGAGRLALADVRVADLLEGAAAEASIGGRAVRVESCVQPADLVVRGDAARLAQVVANLLDNAVRHSPVDGVVRVRAALAGAGRWSLEVSDEGPGFPPGQTEKLFARFGVGDDAGGGTGLGLAIARWICQLHGGTIAALPAEGGAGAEAGAAGARVRAVLPLDPEPAAAPPAASPTPPATPPAPTSGTGGTAYPGAAGPLTAPAPIAVPAPTALDALFGGLWPERGLRTAPVALWASVAVGALGAVLLPYRGPGLAAFLVLVAAGGLVLTLSERRSRPWTVLSTALCLGLALLVLVRAAEWLVVLSLLTAAVLVTTALTGARGVLPMLGAAVSWVLSGLRGLPLLRRTLTATSRHRMLWPVLRTAAVSLVALVVFGGLFASGDAVFGSWVERLLPDWQVAWADELVLRGFLWFLVGGVVLAASYLALNPPRVERLHLGPGRPVARAWEWAVPVAVVVAVFVGFLVAQASAMWGGHEFVRRTTGMTYAESVHQGFGQLTLATALTLLTVALVVRKAPTATPRDRALLRGLLGALCGLTLVVVASALYRMWVYQEAYGFTVLRVLVDAFELWLGLLVVLVLVAGLRGGGWWLPRAALAGGAAMLLVIGLANPEAWVAQRNIDRYESTGRLDLAYLASLGADAVPTIEAGLPADLAACASGWSPDPELTEDWLSWNLGRARAGDGVEVEGAVPTAGGDPACPAEIAP